MIKLVEQKSGLDGLEDNDPGSPMPRTTRFLPKNGNTEIKAVESYPRKPRPARYVFGHEVGIELEFRFV